MNCEFVIPQGAPSTDKSEGPNAAALTVGQSFHLRCLGEIPPLRAQDLKLEGGGYLVVLQQVETLTAQEALLRVTTYQVGQHQIQNLLLTDGLSSLQIPAMPLQVQSVFEPKEPRDPIGLKGPFHLPLHWLWLVLVLNMAALLVARYWRRKKEKAEALATSKKLAGLDSVVPPQVEFFRKVFSLERNFSCEALQEILCRYFFRTTRVVDEKKVAQFFVAPADGSEWKNLMDDLRAGSKLPQLSSKEADLFLRRARHLVERPLRPIEQKKSFLQKWNWFRRSS